MKALSRVAGCLALAIACNALLLTGCGGSGKSGATATGDVSYDGRIVEEGEIVFTPVDGKAKAVKAPIKHGMYKAEGLPIGPCMVLVTGSKLQEADGKDVSAEYRGGANGKDLVPANALGNNFGYTVIPGVNNLSLLLAKPASQAGNGEPSPAAMAVTIAQLTKEYADNEESADKKYKDKLVQFEGVVAAPPKGSALVQVHLKDLAGDKNKSGTVQWLADSADVPGTEKAKALKVGQKIKVKGKCKGRALGETKIVDVIDGKFIEIGPAPKP